MEGAFTDAQKNSQDGRENSLHSFCKEKDLSGVNKLDCSRLESDKCVTEANTQANLVSNLKQLQGSKSYIQDSFLPSVHALGHWIPKHMVTIDEKSLGRCLQFIHISASKPAPCNFSLIRGWGNMGRLLSDSFILTDLGAESNCNLSRFEFDSSLAARSGAIVISPAGEWIVGSITGSKNMMNILKSPLLQPYGAYDGVPDFPKESSNGNEGSLGYDFVSSPAGLSDCSFSMLDRGVQSPRNNNQGFRTLHERFISMSSTNSASSDHSSCSASGNVTQGMLQCSWKGGKPHFVFSVDEQKMVYEAKLLSNEPADDKALDHTYVVHSRADVQKERVIRDDDLIGVIKVSTSFTLCHNNSRIMERAFVLFGRNKNSIKGLETSSHDRGKSKGLQKKVAEVFRNKQSFKKRTTSKFGGSSSALEDWSWEPVQDAENNADAVSGANLLVNSPPPNLELAAIIVKDHLPENRLEKVGGWGLKFLRKVVVAKEMTGIMESSTTSSCCARDTGDCSTSMDVIIPAGLHGGPRTRNGGPSGLVERWRSGGCCDCGGWDLGCPLTLFRSRSKLTEISSETDTQGQCKLTDLYIEGSEKSGPPLRMVNVHKGLYFVNFQSTLSALQSFSIAVAFIHGQSPALRPKSVKEV